MYSYLEGFRRPRYAQVSRRRYQNQSGVFFCTTIAREQFYLSGGLPSWNDGNYHSALFGYISTACPDGNNYYLNDHLSFSPSGTWYSFNLVNWKQQANQTTWTITPYYMPNMCLTFCKKCTQVIGWIEVSGFKLEECVSGNSDQLWKFYSAETGVCGPNDAYV